MALQLWLPLNRDFRNAGLTKKNFSSSTVSIENNFSATFSKTTGVGIYAADESFMANCINNKSFTLAIWFKTTAGDTNLMSLSYGLRLFAGATTYVSLYNSKGTINCTTMASNDGKWHHVAATYDKDTNIITIYLDGIKKSTNVYTLGGTYASSWSNGIYIGRDPNDNTANSHYFFQGNLRDARVYDNCLTDSDVSELAKGEILNIDPYKGAFSDVNNLWAGKMAFVTCYNGSLRTYGFNSGTAIYQTTVTATDKYGKQKQVIKVYNSTEQATVTNYLYFTPMAPTASDKHKILSFDIYPTRENKINSYTYYSGYCVRALINGEWTNYSSYSVDVPIETNKWNHVVLDWAYSGATADSGPGYVIIGSSHATNTTDYWLFDNIQIEVGDAPSRYAKLSTSAVGIDWSGISRYGTGPNVKRVDNHLTLNGNGYYNCGNLTFVKESISAAWWGNMSNWSNYGRAFSCTEGGGWNFELNNGKMSFPLYAAGYGYIHAIDNVDANTLSGWHHFVGTFDGTVLKFYRDGVLTGSETLSSARQIAYYDNVLFVGGEATNSKLVPSGGNYYGDLGEMSVFAKALTQAEVTELYNKGHK